MVVPLKTGFRGKTFNIQKEQFSKQALPIVGSSFYVPFPYCQSGHYCLLVSTANLLCLHSEIFDFFNLCHQASSFF